ncbi:hypothetical protein [Leisingera caerulea]|uniref:hypothetical protein n=1 Tax=Leisingera caerulea TaxID=506591 RepID=UPI00048469A2|nr:hypothetical protein [Leisingera caerulea]
MIFEIKNSCFDANPKTQRLLELADFVVRGRHRIYVENEEDIEYANWLETLPPDLADGWQLALDVSMESEALEPAKLKISVCEQATIGVDSIPPSLTVEDATRLGREPYRIFVENSDADRNFLLTFSNFQQKRKLEELERENLLRFEHCGGIGDLSNKVQSHLAKNPLFFEVCATVYDSDAKKPNAPSTQAKAVETFCTERSIASFMLKRRAIENYLMLSWIRSWATKRPNRKARKQAFGRLDSLCKLNMQQRSHLHMKKGLAADANEIQGGAHELFQGIDVGALEQLQTGFGNDIGSDIYSETWVQNSQPSEDQDAWDEVNGVVSEVMVLCR